LQGLTSDELYDSFGNECVKGRKYNRNTARSYCDQATAKLGAEWTDD